MPETILVCTLSALATWNCHTLQTRNSVTLPSTVLGKSRKHEQPLDTNEASWPSRSDLDKIDDANLARVGSARGRSFCLGSTMLSTVVVTVIKDVSEGIVTVLGLSNTVVTNVLVVMTLVTAGSVVVTSAMPRNDLQKGYVSSGTCLSARRTVVS